MAHGKCLARSSLWRQSPGPTQGERREEVGGGSLRVISTMISLFSVSSLSHKDNWTRDGPRVVMVTEGACTFLLNLLPLGGPTISSRKSVED